MSAATAVSCAALDLLVVYVTAPGNLKIQMMHKQHVVEEIQKLMDYEEYMEVLIAPPSAPAPDPGQQQQPQPGTSQDGTQSSAVPPPAKKQRPTRAGKSPRRKATDKVKSGPFVEGTKPKLQSPGLVTLAGSRQSPTIYATSSR